MGRLTKEVFNESCCDGGKMNDDPLKSCQPCGCDEGALHACERHYEEIDDQWDVMLSEDEKATWPDAALVILGWIPVN
jgi:hypothetical protein